MKKQINFTEAKEIREDNRIEETLKKEFDLPEVVEKARQDAFRQIRELAAGQETSGQQKTSIQYDKFEDKRNKKHKKVNIVYRFIASAAAAAAIFSGVCITNPAFAANVPLVGGVFAQIGNSLGFSGDFSEYATPLTEKPEGEDFREDKNAADGSVQIDYEQEKETGETEEAKNTENTENTGDELYTKTVNGVTVTLSEVYCNEVAMYVSMMFESEEPFPPTIETEGGAPWIDLMDSEMQLSFNPEFRLLDAFLDGKMLDEHTYAGVLRLDAHDYAPEMEVPETFSVDLNIRSISGSLPEEHWRTPEESNKFPEDSPEMRHPGNPYQHWFLEGPWDFSFTVEKNLSRNETKEVNLLDEDGYGITTITKTPFEFVMEIPDPEGRYAAVMLDADGNRMENGNFAGSVNNLAIQDRDVSTVYVYLCDYYEYMDELKGYCNLPDYETGKQEKSFKDLLDERAVFKAEIVF